MTGLYMWVVTRWRLFKWITHPLRSDGSSPLLLSTSGMSSEGISLTALQMDHMGL